MWIAGETTMETSQNAGRPFIAGDPSGGVNVPPAKDFAVIDVTSFSSRVAKFSQVPADAVDTAATAPNRTAAHDSSFDGHIMISLPLTHFTALAPCCTCTGIIGQSCRP